MTTLIDTARRLEAEILRALALADAAGFSLAGIHLNAALATLGHPGTVPPGDAAWRERECMRPLPDPPGAQAADRIHDRQEDERA